MSKVMMIVGILLAAIGIALALMVFFSPGPMQVYGITLEVASILLVGGVIALGLGGAIGTFETGGASPSRQLAAGAPAQEGIVATSTAVTTAAVAAKEEVEESLSPAVSETIKALERAKTDLQTAFEDKKSGIEPEVESVPAAVQDVLEEDTAEADPDDESQLYVLEERSIRGHAARLLSDGTVEAETSEGWMRFENLEHLDEYLDAMEPRV